MSENKEVCAFDINKLDSEFSNLLFLKNDYKAAGDLLDVTSKSCAPDDYHKAVIIDLAGMFQLYCFRINKNLEVALQAQNLFEKAIKLNTKRNERIYYHMSLLMQEKEDMQNAVMYIKKAVELGDDKSSEMTDYYSVYLVLAADAENWEEAKKMTNILINRDKQFYFQLPPLLAAVKTLCHYGKWQVAEKFVSDVEGYRNDITGEKKVMFDHTKKILQSCSPTKT